MQRPGPRPAMLPAALSFVASACIGDPTIVQNELRDCADPQIDVTGWQAGSTVTFDYKVPPYHTRLPEQGRCERGESWITDAQAHGPAASPLPTVFPGRTRRRPPDRVRLPARTAESASGVDREAAVAGLA